MSMAIDSALFDGLVRELPGLSAGDRLKAVAARVSGDIVFTTSFGLEDQVITHLIAQGGLNIRLATLDTGRMFAETYGVWAETEARYGVTITPFYPERAALESLVTDQGINGFYAAVAARKACCGARKVQPLARALEGASIWITGIRGDQSDNRASAAYAEIDAGRGLIKVNPLFDWTRAAAADFAREHAIPLNPLHEKGFLSIGCAPCTRALEPGEPERAGRWWWEDDAKKECGLHVGPDGRLVRGPQPEAVA